MRKKKGDITQDELLAILEQSGCPNFTKRRLTQLTGEGLLPQLRRTARAGSNRPVYMWGQEVIEQAKYLYDLIERGDYKIKEKPSDFANREGNHHRELRRYLSLNRVRVDLL